MLDYGRVRLAPHKIQWHSEHAQCAMARETGQVQLTCQVMGVADKHHTRDSVTLVCNGLRDGTSTTGRWTMGVAV